MFGPEFFGAVKPFGFSLVGDIQVFGLEEVSTFLVLTHWVWRIV